MIQVDHMATAAKKRVQENFVGQVTEANIKEMKDIENVSRKYWVKIKERKAFREVHCSSRLKKFVEENELWYDNWKYVITRMEKIVREENDLKHKENVIKYREKYMYEDKLKKEKYITGKDIKTRYWKPHSICCFVCNREDIELQIVTTHMQELKKE